MKRGLPSIDAVRVISCSDSPNGFVFEMPKSSTFTSGPPAGPRVTKRFASLMSRWTMPSACASASASHACMTYSAASLAGMEWRCFASAARSQPSRYSITMYGSPPSSVPTS